MPGRTTFAAFAVALLIAGIAHGGAAATAKLRLDGATLRPELAVTGAQRTRGLMLRTRAPADGMLFVFPSATSGGFWMKNTLVPLRIVFFDSRGRRVRALTMTPCTTDECRIYAPGRQYRFALELPAGDRRPARQLGPASALRYLMQRSS